MMNSQTLIKEKTGETGFSYSDVMIAVTILLAGIMAMLSAITTGAEMTATNQQQLAAKQYAQSIVEAIFSARDINTLGFDSIGNVGDSTIPGGVFLTGQQPFYPTRGPDGITGTADDKAGPDRVVGTSDDVKPVDGFLCQIEIANVPDPDRPLAPITLRQIKVSIFYMIGNAQLCESMTTFADKYQSAQP